MTYDDFYNLLRSGQLTTDLGTSGKDDLFGYGLINAQKAVLAAQQGTLPTAIIVNPPSLHFGANLSTMTLWIEKSGDSDADLSVTSVEGDADWIQVEPMQTDAFGLGAYTVSVSRSELDEGSYTGAIEILSSANDTSVPVSLQVVQSGRIVSAGYHYVLLLDSSTYETLAQTEAQLEEGVYTFSFSDVAEGEYLLFAGSDMDNDSVIGDLGNAIGAYLSTDQPVVLQVDQDIHDLDFKTEFNIYLSDDGALDGVPYRSVNKLVDEERFKRIK
jgi:serine protease